MRNLLLSAAMIAGVAGGASAETVGVSMALFDDNFLTVLRNGIQKDAEAMDGVDVQIEDAQNDVAKQLDQINNFIASGVDAIIVNPVDTSATQAMTDAASAAGMPCWAMPTAKPPTRLMNRIRMPAMASPRMNLLAPSIAP